MNSDKTSAAPVAAEARVTPGAAVTPVDDGSEGGGRRANRGVWIRAFIYVIGFHIFAGFVMLMFYVGSHRH